MRKRLIVLVLVGGLLVGGVALFLVILLSQDGYQPAPVVSSTPSTPRTSVSEFRNEAHWLAAEVVGEMTRWAALSGEPATAKVTPNDASGVLYAVEGVAGELRIAQHIWHPEDYLPLARILLAKAPPGSSPASEEEGENLAASLLNPLTLVMLARDTAVSARLAASPADPLLHEQAALLCATMAYREAAGRFCDARRELCAATAHLALARVGRPVPGICGRIALALIDALSQREVAALAAVETLPATGRLAGWRRAIHLRATGNWVQSTIERGASMIEQLAHCRALAYHQGDAATVAWLDLAQPISAPDWGWIVCETGVSVENGHRFARGGLEEEFEELRTLWQQVQRRDMDQADLTAALTLSDEKGKSRRVLSIKRWSAFLDRHRAHRLVVAHNFCQYTWGDGDAAKELRDLCAGPLAAAPLMPMVRMHFSQDKKYLTYVQQTAEMVGRDPSLLTAWMWAHYRFGKFKTLMPKARDWWGGIAPPGTAMHASIRADLLTTLQQQVGDQAERALLIAPHDAGLKIFLAHLRGLKDTASLTALFGDQAEWNLHLAGVVAKHAKPGEERLAAYRRMAALDPEWNIELARELVKMKHEQDAVAVYEAAYKDCADRVLIANSMGWLVTWHADHGNMPRAREIADHGYEVFSHAGIETRAKLDERIGDLAAAEKALEALHERYDDEGPLLAFWKRTAPRRPESRAAYERQEKTLFPRGQRLAKVSGFSGRPVTGVEVTSNSQLASENDIRLGHVIVAIDGVACDTTAQYYFLRALTVDQPLAIIVWDGNGYRQVIADVPNRRLRVNLADWTSGQELIP
ncbi:MAG: hypothetical protein H0W78_13410 [Planctomycetes bacterium]|nr:hypothetical protein [Planctomycetota bacterium]